jgi:hypothetical protein
MMKIAETMTTSLSCLQRRKQPLMRLFCPFKRRSDFFANGIADINIKAVHLTGSVDRLPSWTMRAGPKAEGIVTRWQSARRHSHGRYTLQHFLLLVTLFSAS